MRLRRMSSCTSRAAPRIARRSEEVSLSAPRVYVSLESDRDPLSKKTFSEWWPGLRDSRPVSRL